MKVASTPAECITSVMKGCTSFVLLVSGNVLVAESSTALSAIQRDVPNARIKTLHCRLKPGSLLPHFIKLFKGLLLQGEILKLRGTSKAKFLVLKPASNKWRASRKQKKKKLGSSADRSLNTIKINSNRSVTIGNGFLFYWKAALKKDIFPQFSTFLFLHLWKVSGLPSDPWIFPY